MKNSRMLFVAAGGNYGKDIDIKNKVYPACFELDNIISIADMRCDGKLSYTSNYGKRNIDVAAPRTNIVGQLSYNKDTYFCDTSSATAMVTDEAALIWNFHLEVLGPLQIKNIVIKNVDTTDYLKEKVLSGGYINIYKAIECFENN